MKTRDFLTKYGEQFVEELLQLAIKDGEHWNCLMFEGVESALLEIVERMFDSIEKLEGEHGVCFDDIANDVFENLCNELKEYENTLNSRL